MAAAVSRLTRKRIPESSAQIEKTGRARSFRGEQVPAAKQIDGDPRGAGQRSAAGTDPGAGLEEVRPDLPLFVYGEPGIPVELQRARNAADARLVVQQDIFPESGNVECVHV